MSNHIRSILIAASRAEARDLHQLIPAGAAVRSASDRQDLDEILSCDEDWLACVATDGFDCPALTVAGLFRRRAPLAPVLVITDEPDIGRLTRAIDLVAFVAPRGTGVGCAAGFLAWSTDVMATRGNDLLAAFDDVGKASRLTGRERAVLAASSLMGATKREISEITGVAITTVKTQRQTAAGKIGSPGIRAVRRLLLERLLRRQPETR